MINLIGLEPDGPHTEKETFYGTTEEYVVGAGSMQGWRPSMEDSFAIMITLPQDRETTLFGVFDGHGSNLIADYVSQNIYHYIVSDSAFVGGRVVAGIESAFLRLDGYLMRNSKYNKVDAGSAAIVALIRNNTLYCANVGDSRAVAYVGGKAIPLSTDHKPTLQQEKKRILQAGCFINFERINGDLALSRAFGDFVYKRNKNKGVKEQAVVSVPEIMERKITKEWEFLVIACDGIWDVMSNENVCRFVKVRIKKNMKPDEICVKLMDKCLCKDPRTCYVGTDNMTVIIVVFLNNVCRPYTGVTHSPSSSIRYVGRENK